MDMMGTGLQQAGLCPGVKGGWDCRAGASLGPIPAGRRDASPDLTAIVLT